MPSTTSLRPSPFLVILTSLAFLAPGPRLAAQAPSQPPTSEPPATLELPESRNERIRLPDIALPLADPGTPGKVSLADLRGEKYILHVFASW